VICDPPSARGRVVLVEDEGASPGAVAHPALRKLGALRNVDSLPTDPPMKKLFILQIAACVVLSLLGWQLGLDAWQIALFAWVPVFLAGYAWFWWFRTVFFYRDPERRIPEGDDLIVSPADGRVMYVREVEAGEVVSDKQGRRIRISELAKTDLGDVRGRLVGIYMSPFDVHFNRAPIGGEIRTVHHHRTPANLPMVDLWEYVSFTLFRKAVDLFAAPFHLENERLTMQIRNGRLSCVLILIADQFVNKISRYFDEAQHVLKGDKISFIARGSQTDLLIPCEELSIQVQPGDQVFAGQTIIATFDQ
jgi:phosphatidylserine decarboxylase